MEPVSLINSITAGSASSGLQRQLGSEMDFAAWFDRQLDELNQQIGSSEVALRNLAAGETDNIHHVMLSLEKAKLSFQLMLQVRNKALEAYQEVMRMQL
jgi:flagellar hook-basal body complex protein FliE